MIEFHLSVYLFFRIKLKTGILLSEDADDVRPSIAGTERKIRKVKNRLCRRVLH